MRATLIGLLAPAALWLAAGCTGLGSYESAEEKGRAASQERETTAEYWQDYYAERSLFARYFRHTAPESYPPIPSTKIFAYGNLDLQLIYESLFGDFLVIGRSVLTGPWLDPLASSDLAGFARYKGADILIISSVLDSSITSLESHSIAAPFFQGYVQRTDAVPVTENRFRQQAFF